MVNKEIKFDFDDLLIQPCDQSKIVSRKQVNIYDENGMLPLFTAPMDTVIDITNYKIFQENKIHSIIPRTYNGLPWSNQWKAIGLKEFEDFFLNKDKELAYRTNGEYKILIDIANGHMEKLVDMVRMSKECWGDKLTIMVGNVANPETYKYLSEAGASFVRIGIGNGGGCLTSQNVGVGYPLASLINECYEISCTLKNPAKIVADGGMKNYSDIIKALALGADSVMVGSILNRALESAGETHRANVKHVGVETWTEPGEVVDQYSENVKNAFQNGAKFYKKFRGMSTKGVQKLLGNEDLKTSEGVTRMNPVEYTLEGWVENFRHYLASAMSYTGTLTLYDFIGKVNLNLITQSSFNRFNK
jgi:IMP dehydrogenase/GMP reductase